MSALRRLAKDAQRLNADGAPSIQYHACGGIDLWHGMGAINRSEWGPDRPSYAQLHVLYGFCGGSDGCFCDHVGDGYLHGGENVGNALRYHQYRPP